MRQVLRSLGVATCVLIAMPVHAQSPKRPIRVDDLAKIRSVGDPQVSPDGKWVAYAVGTVDAEKDKRDSDVWMASWDGSEQVRLTFTGDTSENNPRWSPDNKYLAFLTTRGDETEKKQGSQVWILNRAGGEAQQLTNIKGGVSDFAWSPDAKRLVLVVKDDSRSLLFSVADDRISYIGKISSSGGNVEKITSGLRVVSNISRRDDSSFALLSTTSTEPDEAYAFENGALRRLTHQNDDLFGRSSLERQKTSLP